MKCLQIHSVLGLIIRLITPIRLLYFNYVKCSVYLFISQHSEKYILHKEWRQGSAHVLMEREIQIELQYISIVLQILLLWLTFRFQLTKTVIFH